MEFHRNEAMRNAEEAGTRLEQALEDIAAMAPAFTVDAGSVQAKIQAAIAALGKNLIKQG